MLFRLWPKGLLLAGIVITPAYGAGLSLAQFLNRTYGQGGTAVTRMLGKFGSFLSSGPE